MTPDPDRRNAMRLSLHVAALNSIPFITAQGAADQKPKENDSMTNDPTHDFDLFFGSWRAQHRRLKARLANNNEWIEFDGTSTMQSRCSAVTATWTTTCSTWRAVPVAASACAR